MLSSYKLGVISCGKTFIRFLSIRRDSTSGFAKGLIISSRIPFSRQTGLFGKLHSAVYKLVLETGDKELDFTADELIYCIIYLHKI